MMVEHLSKEGFVVRMPEYYVGLLSILILLQMESAC